MRCCQGTACGTGRFFSRFARRYRRRYQKKGLERTQEQLVAGVLAGGISGCSLLEVGCGVGYLHQHLLALGARSAQGVDLSQAMLDEAATLAAQNGLSERVCYHQGDLVELADSVGPADIALLDKVICCYPDAQRLLQVTLDKTLSVCALTYPRNHVWNRVGIAVLGMIMTVLRGAYRPYFYEPDEVAKWIAQKGFTRTWSAKTAWWQTEIYHRVP